jgi:hypothetical protein
LREFTTYFSDDLYPYVLDTMRFQEALASLLGALPHTERDLGRDWLATSEAFRNDLRIRQPAGNRIVVAVFHISILSERANRFNRDLT